MSILCQMLMNFLFFSCIFLNKFENKKTCRIWIQTKDFEHF